MWQSWGLNWAVTLSSLMVHSTKQEICRLSGLKNWWHIKTATTITTHKTNYIMLKLFSSWRSKKFVWPRVKSVLSFLSFFVNMIWNTHQHGYNLVCFICVSSPPSSQSILSCPCFVALSKFFGVFFSVDMAWEKSLH